MRQNQLSHNRCLPFPGRYRRNDLGGPPKVSPSPSFSPLQFNFPFSAIFHSLSTHSSSLNSILNSSQLLLPIPSTKPLTSSSPPLLPQPLNLPLPFPAPLFSLPFRISMGIHLCVKRDSQMHHRQNIGSKKR